MTVHVLLLLFISAVALFIFRRRSLYSYQRNRYFVIIAFSAIWLVQALRSWQVGWDSDVYYSVFINHGTGTILNDWEFLYVLLMDVVHLFTESPVVLMGIVAAIINFGIGYFVLKNTPDDGSAFWPTFFYVTMSLYFSSMNLWRQFLAIAVGVNIYTVLSRSRSVRAWITSALLVAIAGNFHTAGYILALLAVPFIPKTLNKASIRIMMPISIIAATGITFLMNLLTSIIPKFRRYLTSVRWQSSISSGYYYLLTAIFALVVLAFYFFSNHIQMDQSDYRLMLIALMAIPLFIMTREVRIVMRIAYGFEFFAVLIIPAFMNKLIIDTKNRFVIKFVFFAVFWAYFIYNMTVGSARGCVPYTFFWQVA